MQKISIILAFLIGFLFWSVEAFAGAEESLNDWSFSIGSTFWNTRWETDRYHSDYTVLWGFNWSCHFKNAGIAGDHFKRTNFSGLYYDEAELEKHDIYLLYSLPKYYTFLLGYRVEHSYYGRYSFEKTDSKGSFIGIHFTYPIPQSGIFFSSVLKFGITEVKIEQKSTTSHGGAIFIERDEDGSTFDLEFNLGYRIMGLNTMIGWMIHGTKFLNDFEGIQIKIAYDFFY